MNIQAPPASDQRGGEFASVLDRWRLRRKARRYYEWGRAVEIAARGSQEGPRAARLFSRGLRAFGPGAHARAGAAGTADDPSAVRQRLEKALSLSAPLRRLWSWSRRHRTVAAAGVLMAAAAVAVLARATMPQNIAVDRPWRASSGDAGFPLAGRVLDAAVPTAFMHTKDENEPWVVIDLEALREMSRIEVTNRRDCCGERAVPLVVEASLNGETWIPIARRSGAFTGWRASITPRMTRFVRFRLDRRGILHLGGIRLFG